MATLTEREERKNAATDESRNRGSRAASGLRPSTGNGVADSMQKSTNRAPPTDEGDTGR
jgi:hypothetical protein